jgi:uncharacterized protein (DUF58 family)
MRAALRGLTTRGRSLLAAGVASGLVALALRNRDVLRVSVLLLALPLLAAAAVSRTRYRLSCTRTLDPPRVPVGRDAEVVLRTENVGRLPTSVLLLEDTLPYVLGARPRFVLDRVRPDRRLEVSYKVRSEVRGRFTIGPLTVRLTDPFGLVELTRSFHASDLLVITPRVVPLPAVRLTGEWGGSGESRARSIATAGEDDVATRVYRQGDDLRRVHWRSTARYGELMVRREEQPWQSRGAILLDVRAAAHRGDGPGSSVEWAISAAASVGVHLARTGYDVRLVTDTGSEVGGHISAAPSASSMGTTESTLLDALAVTQPSTSGSLAPGIEAMRRGGGEGLLIAVLGAIDVDEAEQLARLRQHGATTGIALMLDPSTWVTTVPRQRALSGADERAEARAVLSGAGWRILEARYGDDLADVWQRAAVGAARLPA